VAQISFPKNFHWGTATASYQIEGAWQEDDKGESIWDRFTHSPGHIRNGDTGDVACDHYHRYLEDVALMRRMNLSSYRFSIAWPRVQPQGRGKPNRKGVGFYDRLTDALLEAGIRPFPTLYHWDLPQALQDEGGWQNRDTASRFAEYAEIMMQALGDRISDWMIFNEPAIFTIMGHLAGIHAPGLKDRNAFVRSSHIVTLAQGDAFRALRSAKPDAKLGTAFSMSFCEPASESKADHDAAERFHRFINAWYLEPALYGRYPEAHLDGVPAEAMGIQDGDMERTRAALDFIGINLYTRTIVAHAPDDPHIGARPVGGAGGDDGPRTDFGWEVWPEALYQMVMRVTRDYDRPTIEITENGCAYNDGPDSRGRIRDTRRIDFYQGYLGALARAMEEGADVRGYHAWTLMDNFEWSEGFAQRFGLVYVDFPSGKRIPKESAHWYAEVASQGALPSGE
jgi:beta-glucosidase